MHFAKKRVSAFPAVFFKPVIIRKAVIEDLEALLYIYNYEVLNGTATLDITPQTIDKRKRWFDAHTTSSHPLICAVDDDGRVVGYASLSTYREKEAYCSTVELSVYIHPEHRRKGIAKCLMEHIIGLAKAEKSIHTIVSVITSGNTASTHLHEAFGFTFCGRIKHVAEKFGRSIDIDNYELFV